jgi:hypothetical protein
MGVVGNDLIRTLVSVIYPYLTSAGFTGAGSLHQEFWERVGINIRHRHPETSG